MARATRRHTTKPATKSQKAAPVAVSVTDDADPLVAIGIRLGVVMSLEDDLDARANEAGKERRISAEIYLKKALKHAVDEKYIQRNALSCLKATSLAGAALQIVEAMNIVDLAWNSVAEGDDTIQLDRDKRAIERLLFSALNAVERLAGLRVDDIVSPSFVGRNLDPWLSVEDQCGELMTWVEA